MKFKEIWPMGYKEEIVESFDNGWLVIIVTHPEPLAPVS